MQTHSDAPAESPAGATEDLTQRRVPLEGAVNFRDLGGYPVGDGRRTRWRRLFRSDSLAALTDEDLEHVAALDLYRVVDFRLPHERELHPNRLPAGAAPMVAQVGFWPDGVPEMLAALRELRIDAAGIERAVTGHYRRYAVHHCAEYRRMLEAVEEAAGRPTLIHCVSGKDRTGFGAAVILMALGAPRSVIVDDYLLTNACRRDIGHLMPPGTTESVAEAFTAARPAYIEAAFESIDTAFGGIDDYLAHGLGFGEQRLQRLRECLTEPATGSASLLSPRRAGNP
ncbi:MAG: tyrosine-protein phosphatase [Piscinibacter sp.]|jgi:protein-tyrosine phosphatase|uniref:tyrosine-protein phosphatase n=1 Tax=Piscinibacter sp. TaxID=1903157 RepID=UPI003D10D1CA